ncbi:MAG: nuclear transport factor 2 family protein [Actinomycetota bacterium]|nr:nuclear transport factor 2 family protein [Actinomycetota bacterium]
MGRWSREELEGAFENYQQTVREIAATGEWSRFADLFTPDASYNEHAYGRFHGREAIRKWIVSTMTTFPGSSMVSFPISWYVVDEDRGWIICEVQNVMADPGDASVHQEPNMTILYYAGDQMFSYEEDVYNPARYLPMVLAWSRVAQDNDRFPAEGDAWLKLVGRRTG